MNELNHLIDDYHLYTKKINNLNKIISETDELTADALQDGIKMYQKLRRNLFFKIRTLQNIQHQPRYSLKNLNYNKLGLQLTLNNDEIINIPIKSERIIQ